MAEQSEGRASPHANCSNRAMSNVVVFGTKKIFWSYHLTNCSTSQSDGLVFVEVSVKSKPQVKASAKAKVLDIKQPHWSMHVFTELRERFSCER